METTKNTVDAFEHLNLKPLGMELPSGRQVVFRGLDEIKFKVIISQAIARGAAWESRCESCLNRKRLGPGSCYKHGRCKDNCNDYEGE